MRGLRVGTSVIVVVVAATGMLAWRWQQRGPGHASVSSAIDLYRASPTTVAPTGAHEPRPGVYLYTGKGTESLSFLSTSQGQGPTEPGTVVRQAGGCWQFRIDFNSFHHETWSRCSIGSTLTESGSATVQQFDFMTFKTSEHSTVTCSPPGRIADLTAAVGSTSEMLCTGHSQTTNATFSQAGTATLVGRESIVVGGVGVPALHTREAFTLTGGQTGTVRIDIWLAVSDFLPLKESHDIRVKSPAPAPLNHVTYSERGSWQLTSLAPRT